jgi:hypothetical protein
MTTITAGMTPAQFNTAMNGNVTSAGFTGRSIIFDTTLLGHEVRSAEYMNSIASLAYGISGKSYIDGLNTGFAAISLADIAITGVVDSKVYGVTGNGSTDDTANLQTAINAGNVIIQNGTFKVSACITIPSNRTIYIKNAKIKKAGYSFDNFFRNSDPTNGNVNIKILGLGNAELDGTSTTNSDTIAFEHWGYNGQMNYMKSGGVAVNQALSVYKYRSISFYNVTGFEISGIYFYDIPHLGVGLQKCSIGSFHDIKHDNPNIHIIQSCIDLGRGSNNIEIYNISTITEDDFGYLNASKYNGPDRRDITGWDSGDIHDINYHDIKILSSTRLIFVAVGDGVKLYNIKFADIRINEAYYIYGAHAFTSLFYDANCAKTDQYNITFDRIKIDSITAKGGAGWPYCFPFEQSLKDFSVTNFINNSGVANYKLGPGDQTDNVKINGVQVS